MQGDPSYTTTLSRLRSLGRFGVRFGLEPMRRAMAGLGDPHLQFDAVHIAGTNGKGSTAAMLESCLREAGVRTGLFTSPHLCRFTERIRVNGEEIPQGRLARLAGEVMDRFDDLTFFEVATAVAFAHFAERGVELAVVEAGMGGELDATNVLSPRVSVLTRISLDHTAVLGGTLAEIAANKAGIIKRLCPVVSAPIADPGARAAVSRACVDNLSEAFFSGQGFDLVDRGHGHSFRFAGRVEVEGVAPPLSGEHQRENAALCLATVALLRRQGMALDDEPIRRGLSRTRWPGRMQRLGQTLLDGAHNPDAVARLVAALPDDRPITAVVGLLGPRDPAAMIGPLARRCDHLLFCPVQSPRTLCPEDLARPVPGSRWAPSLARALELTDDSPGIRLITGSLYLVGEALTLLAGEPADPLTTGDPAATSPTG